MKNIVALLIGLFIAIGFLFLIYKLLPLGIALVITAGMCGAASYETDNKYMEFLLTGGGWLWPVGVIVTFFQNGWLLGIVSIFLGFVSYSFAKTRNKN